MPFFQRLITQDKAWALYVMMVQKHITNCKAKKLATNYGTASDEQKRLLEKMDIEISAYEAMIEIPAQCIRRTLINEHETEEKNLIEEVKQDVKEERDASSI